MALTTITTWWPAAKSALYSDCTPPTDATAASDGDRAGGHSQLVRCGRRRSPAHDARNQARTQNEFEPPERRKGARAGASGVIVSAVPGSPLSLIEFPADDPERARRFWVELLGLELEARQDGEGQGWQTHTGAPAVGVHARGRGPGDSFSLPYFAVSDVADALERIEALGGSVVHPGQTWAICKDSEGSPFGLAQESLGG
jgi:predicted enzyme related to lactoylglutathione lyase